MGIAMRLAGLIIVYLAAVPMHASESVVFPDNSGYVNIRTRYGAKGDGKTDDTEAFRQASADDVRSLYLPNGTYLVSDSIVLGGKRWILQGESREGTVIRLRDHAPHFDDATRPRPLVSTFAAFMDPNAAMGQAFRNSLFDLTIDIGSGNPGAVGIHYLNNNQGSIRNVLVRTSDPKKRGKAGIALVTNWPGPALFDSIRIEGFDYGIWSTISQYSLVFDRIELEGQRCVGIHNNGQTLTIRRLRSQNTVPAICSAGRSAFVTLLDCDLSGGRQSAAAVESTGGGTLAAFRLRTQGYGTAILSQVLDEVQTVRGPMVNAYVSHPILPASVEHLPAPMEHVSDAPDTPLPPMHEWADVTDFGATPIQGDDVPDAGPGIQEAIDSGKPVVYLPQGTYAVYTTIQVRGKVQRIIGMESRIRGLTEDKPVWKIQDGDSPFVIFERLEGDYESNVTYTFEHASRRPLVLRQMMTRGYRNTVPGGTVFRDDVCGHNWEFYGQTVWVRQLNPEAKGSKDFNIRARDSQLWLLGVKTEGPKTVLLAREGYTELWGGFFYANRGTEPGAAAIDLIDGQFLGNWVNHLGGSYRPQIRHRRAGRLDELWLHVDFSDTEKLPLVLKEVRGGGVVREQRTEQTQQGAAGVFRHGSYGVKVPVFSTPAEPK